MFVKRYIDNVVDKLVDSYFEENLEDENIVAMRNTRKSKKLMELRQQVGEDKEKVKNLINTVLELAVEVSDFDVILSYEANQIVETTDLMSDVSDTIYALFEEITASMSEIDKNIDKFVESIENISQKANEIKLNTKDSGKMFREIKGEVKNFTELSNEMTEYVTELISVASKVNNSLEGINGIAEQINMLALNASIEAARAGEYGRGFNVVAEEIRKLSNDTKDLVKNLGGLVRQINSATNNSTISLNENGKRLDNIEMGLNNLEIIFNENEKSVDEIANDAQGVVGFSQELGAAIQQIHSAMNDTVKTAEKTNYVSKELTQIATRISKTATSIEGLESLVDVGAKLSGELGSSKAYRFLNEEFIKVVEPAINAHKNWMNKLESMVENMKVIPIQTDGHKCGFGHFYHSVTPTNEDILETWKKIDLYHQNLHNAAREVIECINSKEQKRANDYLNAARDNSQMVISLLNELIGKVKELNNKGEHIFS